MTGEADGASCFVRRDRAGKKVDLEILDNAHTVAGILKVFFRELTEPLLTFELYEAWLAAVRTYPTLSSIATKQLLISIHVNRGS
jgi:hypothetical protein